MAGWSLALRIKVLIPNDIFQRRALPPRPITPEPAPTLIGKARAPQGTAQGSGWAQIGGLEPLCPGPVPTLRGAFRSALREPFAAPGREDPRDEYANQNGREAEPRQGILQMIVGQAHH